MKESQALSSSSIAILFLLLSIELFVVEMQLDPVERQEAFGTDTPRLIEQAILAEPSQLAKLFWCLEQTNGLRRHPFIKNCILEYHFTNDFLKIKILHIGIAILNILIETSYFVHDSLVMGWQRKNIICHIL